MFEKNINLQSINSFQQHKIEEKRIKAIKRI